MTSGAAAAVPELAAAFRAARDAVTRELAARPGVAAVLFFGSAARGAAAAGSDLDLYAVTREDARGHLGRVVDGVPVEVSFGSLTQWRALVEGGRPAVVHAFATGRLLFDRTGGAAARLCADAAALWERGPAPPDAAAVLRWRFRLTDMARDLEAMPERAPATALAGAACVHAAVEAFCAARRVWLPPPRYALAVLTAREPAFAEAVRACAGAGFPASGAVTVADLALGDLGGRLGTYDTRRPVAPLGAATLPPSMTSSPELRPGPPAAPPPALETPRLRLRPFAPADAPAVQALAGAREVADTTLTIPHPYPDGAAAAWIATHADAWTAGRGVTYAITAAAAELYNLSNDAPAGGELVGAVSLVVTPAHAAAELGYWVAVPAWGRGYATEAAAALCDYAFAALGVHRIEARHLLRNPASGRVMQKLGMRREGVLRDAVRKWGRFEDLALYAVLAPEWSVARPGPAPRIA